MTDEREPPEPGYAWGIERQERELPEQEYRAHVAILDEMEEEELRALDLKGASDYILWAAAQAFEEIDRRDEAVALLKRIAASASRHPALSYPEILLRLQDYLKESGDYIEALAILDRVEHSGAGPGDDCRERRAEILVLSGRSDGADKVDALDAGEDVQCRARPERVHVEAPAVADAAGARPPVAARNPRR